MAKSMNLKSWIVHQLKEHHIYWFYYIFHSDNLESILKYGILPYNKVAKLGIKHFSFAETTVQEKRDVKEIWLTGDKKMNTHDVVPLYLTPKTPTLYARKDNQDALVIAMIGSYLLLEDNIEYAFTDGNLASQMTRTFYNLAKLDELPWEVIKAYNWSSHPDGVRKRNCEFLIYPYVPIHRIEKFVVNNYNHKISLEKRLKECQCAIEVEMRSDCFF
jgi:hypothetical protein